MRKKYYLGKVEKHWSPLIVIDNSILATESAQFNISVYKIKDKKDDNI